MPTTVASTTREAKTMTGPWMYWELAADPLTNLDLYRSRAKGKTGHGSRACVTDTHYFFQEFGVPTPVNRFRVIVRPERFGEWCISSRSERYALMAGYESTRLIHPTVGSFVMRFVGLYAPGLAVSPWGQYAVWIEYYELGKKQKEEFLL